MEKSSALYRLLKKKNPLTRAVLKKSITLFQCEDALHCISQSRCFTKNLRAPRDDDNENEFRKWAELFIRWTGRLCYTAYPLVVPPVRKCFNIFFNLIVFFYFNRRFIATWFYFEKKKKPIKLSLENNDSILIIAIQCVDLPERDAFAIRESTPSASASRKKQKIR